MNKKKVLKYLIASLISAAIVFLWIFLWGLIGEHRSHSTGSAIFYAFLKTFIGVVGFTSIIGIWRLILSMSSDKEEEIDSEEEIKDNNNEPLA